MNVRLEHLTAKKILAVPVDRCDMLFTGDPDEAKREFRALASRWHPDGNGVDSTVMAHVNALFSVAEQRFGKGDRWGEPNTLMVVDDRGKTFQLRFKKTRPFELGDLYLSDKYVAYVLEKSNDDLRRNGIGMIDGLSYTSDRMHDEIARYLPKVKGIYRNEAGDRDVVLMEKTEDVLLLRDVMEHLGPIDPKHVAWILSTVYNLNCYLKLIAKVSHCAITPDTYFISPPHHSGLLLGGWWYSVPLDSEFKAVPWRLVNLLPADVMKKKLATRVVDAELINALGREMLGDLTGSKLTANKLIPQPMRLWLKQAPSGDPLLDYKGWKETLMKSFGPRRFVKLEVSGNEVYD